MPHSTSPHPSRPSAHPSNPHVEIAIVGAGPRGTSVLERLVASAPEFVKPDARLTVHIVDPLPPGAGRVWRTNQSQQLLMNTVASQITLFTDDSVICDGPIRKGPSLYEWAQHAVDPGLAPDDYPARATYGRYLEWAFKYVTLKAPANIAFDVHAALATRLEDQPAADGLQRLTLSDGRTVPNLAAVILAQGHVPLRADAEQQHASFAKRSNGSLTYIPPANPADVDLRLSGIEPGQHVLLRGLGLSFFDYMALLTTGRGGKFVGAHDGGLRYLASGAEPRMYAASRRGVPLQARGDNAKGPYGRHTPLLLSEARIAGFRQRADAGDAPEFVSDIWPLVQREVETVYYRALLRQQGVDDGRQREFQAAFLAAAPSSPKDRARVLDAFGIDPSSRWDWETVQRPYSGCDFTSPAEWRSWLLGHLRADIAAARLGNVDGPVKAALDVLRDLRNELRLIVDHAGLARRHQLDAWYTPLNAYLSIGPPRLRVEQMVALVEAGLLHVLGPRVRVEQDAGSMLWLASSPEVPGSTVRVAALVEARLPEPDLRRTGDQLLASLMAAGECRPHIVNGYETGGLDVTPSPFRIVDGGGRAHDRRFAVGVPTEGVHWATTAGARPGINSVTLCETDAVARAALEISKREMVMQASAAESVFEGGWKAGPVVGIEEISTKSPSSLAVDSKAEVDLVA